MPAPEGLEGLLVRLRGRPPIEEDERLLELFRNRTALKKELHALDEEHHQLRDRLKLQEGQTQRVEDQLERLYRFLGRPEHAARSLAHFRLREVWRAGVERLTRFSEDLVRQQEDRERQQQLMQFEASRTGRREALERELREARALSDQLLAENKLASQRLAGLRGFWNVFRRRALRRAMVLREARIGAAHSDLGSLEAQREAIEAERPPVFEGLGLEGRRAVNFAVLGCAEWLRDNLAPHELAELARQAALKRVYDADYGDEGSCERITAQATCALREMEQGRNDIAAIKERADRMRRTAKFRRDEDAVPIAESLGGGSRNHLPGAASVLREEFWDAQKLVLP